MRAVVAREFGPPSTFRIEDAPAPEPGAGQLRIGVYAAGLSFFDVLVAEGGYQLKPRLPFTPGSEFAGVVEALGPDVRGLSVGDRVSASSFGGALAEKAVVPAGAAAPIPDGMTFEEASVFRMSYGTAYHALVQRGRLQPGETVLVLGAGGAVGAACVQLAKALGGKVIASASSEAKRELAREMGADATLQTGAEDWRDRIKEITDGRGVDIVVDPVGGEATELAFRSLAWKGRHLVIGFAAGIARLPTNLPLLKGAELVGVDTRQFGEREPALARENQQRLLELYAEGALRPHIAHAFPLERFAEAMTAAREGSAAGRIVVRMASNT